MTLEWHQVLSATIYGPLWLCFLNPDSIGGGGQYGSLDEFKLKKIVNCDLIPNTYCRVPAMRGPFSPSTDKVYRPLKIYMI